MYPVGSIYLSTNSTNPATFIGGTWERLKDVFLLAAGDTYAAGSTGGEAEHTLHWAELPQSTVVATAQVSGKHVFGKVQIADDDSWYAITNNDYDLPNSGKAHNNMPPYLAVYIWKRTA